MKLNKIDSVGILLLLLTRLPSIAGLFFIIASVAFSILRIIGLKKDKKQLTILSMICASISISLGLSVILHCCLSFYFDNSKIKAHLNARHLQTCLEKYINNRKDKRMYFEDEWHKELSVYSSSTPIKFYVSARKGTHFALNNSLIGKEASEITDETVLFVETDISNDLIDQETLSQKNEGRYLYLYDRDLHTNTSLNNDNLIIIHNFRKLDRLDWGKN
ncbi:hypothetical protein [Sedimentisphaera salicampi]|uniref:Uncharacterized protein n=1 Tax=Sedimentisphaera salicampi TaxID=1941349 RepID=A0A1W6LMH7_9BACT|nr:hypothetical protein [Sedimentisphaera salicampi]ARN56985.1 hypothetical protein STSP1_01378 [Sedimentisphaera salicampi]